MSEVQQRSPRLGSTYRPRIKGPERQAIARNLGKEYNAGATIRGLATERSMSYGTVRKLLLEAKVQMRGRGGRVARR
ncbi:transcriptional regulator [Streptomyces sp. LBUM 1478]|uniref:helix-turn-helix domain-containing protein n=1 Tax=Streptomyces scabiei TaxID=1930 RepID=UPI0007660BEA|nr:helix-turn-helix domain-containing protein [Streptomyces scabiei]MBP5906854.1 transcriptional regulator [Streptomyces sp. LBUM 1478]MBP5930419.1 transcriptional regulator [Streptomyces sp. LBUM 1479]